MEYKNVSIEGPTGVIRTSTLGVPDQGGPEVSQLACVQFTVGLIFTYQGIYLSRLRSMSRLDISPQIYEQMCDRDRARSLVLICLNIV